MASAEHVNGHQPDQGLAPELELTVLHEGAEPPVEIVPADRWRPWMNATSSRFANRCLPLLMANQAGWLLNNPAAFEIRWEGGNEPKDMTVTYADGVPDERRIANSHFGYGILTFTFRCYFRTPPGYNLLARGPANSPKDGISALEGLVETDWAVVPFTMNWKLTRPGAIGFEAGEPFCQVVPQRRGELEDFRPGTQTLDGDPELAEQAGSWEKTRMMYLLGKKTMAEKGDPTYRRQWMNDYFRGRTPSGDEGPEHQTTLRLGSFS